jgi:hypothetical protein
LRKRKVISIVSVMESDATPQEALAAAERATASVWTDYPPTPGWYYPGVGVWGAALVYAITGVDSSLVQVPVVLALVAVSAAFMGWYQRYRGAMPRLTSAPAEFRRSIWAFFAVYALLIAAVIVVGFVLDLPVVAAAGTFVVAAAGLYIYEKAYESAARRTKERLG